MPEVVVFPFHTGVLAFNFQDDDPDKRKRYGEIQTCGESFTYFQPSIEDDRLFLTLSICNPDSKSETGEFQGKVYRKYRFPLDQCTLTMCEYGEDVFGRGDRGESTVIGTPAEWDEQVGPLTWPPDQHRGRYGKYSTKYKYFECRIEGVPTGGEWTGAGLDKFEDKQLQIIDRFTQTGQVYGLVVMQHGMATNDLESYCELANDIEVQPVERGEVEVITPSPANTATTDVSRDDEEPPTKKRKTEASPEVELRDTVKAMRSTLADVDFDKMSREKLVEYASWLKQMPNEVDEDSGGVQESTES